MHNSRTNLTYTSRFQKLIHLHSVEDCLIKISPQSSEQIHLFLLMIEERCSETVKNADKLTSEILMYYIITAP